MLRAPDPNRWTGRSDPEDGPTARRWHDVVTCLPRARWSALAQAEPGAIAIIGFACDTGVRRNQGRPGAAEGPDALRAALANTAWHGHAPTYDLGTVVCEGDELEAAQDELAEVVATVSSHGALPLVLGGGHAVAWGTWQGLTRADPATPVGVVNLDAHLDLREPVGGRGTSGTPFRQIASDCADRGWPFRYACLGAAPTSNTAALFARAEALDATVWLDTALAADVRAALDAAMAAMQGAERLHLSLCLDVLPAAVAPGVSAPAALGLALGHVLEIVTTLAADPRLAAVEIAELNPRLDIDGQTARVAARCCHAAVTARDAGRA